MNRHLVEMRYFETYYYANVIHNMLANPFQYVRHINDWHENSQERLFTRPFPRWTVVHSFAAYMIQSLMDEDVDDVTADAIVHYPESELWVDSALRHHGFTPQGFRAWLLEQGVTHEDLIEDHIAEYHASLQESGVLGDLIEQQTQEVFFVVFSNRALLARLNSYIASIVQDMCIAESDLDVRERFAKDGQLKRINIPAWAKRAVFFRDRGRCVQCLGDISGLLTSQNDENYDHIIPLKQGGINDVTNLQLLCGTCNRQKGGQNANVPTRYEAWY